MALNFPASPSTGDVHNASNGLQYHFDGVKWISQGSYNTSTINTLNFTQQGTGAVSRSVQNKLEEVISVKDFGAKGDGSTNDSAAIQLAFNAANATSGQKGKKVVFPEGIYCVESQLSVTLDEAQEQFHVEGLGNVIIKQKHTGNGFNIDINSNHFLENSPSARVTIKGIKFAHDSNSINNSQGKAIFLDGANVAGRHTGLCIIENCSVMAFSDLTKSFSMGIHINELHEVSITKCQFFMDFGDSVLADSINTGVFIDASSSSLPAHYYISNCTFLYGNAGIQIQEYVEGLYVNSCSFVAGDNGIVCQSDGAGGNEPGLQVTNSHFNQGTQQMGYSIRGEGIVDVLIDNNLFYVHPPGGTPTGERGSIYLEKSETYCINNNTFKRIGQPLIANQFTFAITIKIPHTTYEIGSIQSNNFVAFNSAKRAVWLQSDSKKVVVTNNVFKDCNSDVLNEGTNNQVTGNFSFS